MAKNDNSPLIEIKPPDTSALIKGIDSIIGKLDEAHKKLVKISKEKNLGDALVGKSKEAEKTLKQLLSVTSALSKNMEKLQEQSQQAAQAGALDADKNNEIATAIKKVSSTLVDQAIHLSNISDKSEEAQKNVDKLWDTIDPKNLDYQAFVKYAKNIKEYGKTLSEAAQEKRESIVIIEREIAQLKELTKEVYDLEAQTLINEQIEKRVRMLTDEQEKLDGIRKAQSNLNYTGATTGITNAGRGLDNSSAQIDSLFEAVRQGSSIFSNFSDTLKGSQDKATGYAKSLSLVADIMQRAADTNKFVVSWIERLETYGSSLEEFSKMLIAKANTIKGSGESLGGLDKMLAPLSGGLGKLGGVLSFASKAAGPVSLGITAITTGMDIFNEISGKSEDTIRKRIQATKDEVAALQTVISLIRDGNTERLFQERQRIADEISVREQERLALLQNAAETTNIFEQMATNINYTFGNGFKVYGATGAEIDKLTQEISDLNTEANRLASEGLDVAIRRVAELNEVAREADRVFDDVDQQQRTLLDSRIDMLRSEAKLVTDLKTVDADYDAETLRLKDERNAEQLDVLDRHEQNMADTRELYNEATEDSFLNHVANLKDLQANYFEGVRDSWEAHQKDLARLLKDYNETEDEETETRQKSIIDDEKNHRKEMRRAEKDFRREQLERQKDLHETLLQNEMDNDALSYYNNQRAGRIAERKAKEDFDRQQKESEKSFRRQQRDNEEQYAEEKEDRRKAYEEARKQAEEAHELDLAQQYEQYQKNLAAANKNYADEKKQRDDAFTEKMGDLAQQYQDEIDALSLKYDKEDVIREKARAAERKSLQDAYALEVEYYTQREMLLEQYIADLDGIRQQLKTDLSAVEDGTLTAAEFTGSISDAVQAEIDRLRSSANLTEEESNKLAKLIQLSQNPQQTVTDNVTLLAVREAIQNFANAGAVERAEAYEVPLMAKSPEDAALIREAQTYGGDKLLAPALQEGFKNIFSIFTKTIDGLQLAPEITSQQEKQDRIDLAEPAREFSVFNEEITDSNRDYIAARDRLLMQQEQIQQEELQSSGQWLAENNDVKANAMLLEAKALGISILDRMGLIEDGSEQQHDLQLDSEQESLNIYRSSYANLQTTQGEGLGAQIGAQEEYGELAVETQTGIQDGLLAEQSAGGAAMTEFLTGQNAKEMELEALHQAGLITAEELAMEKRKIMLQTTLTTEGAIIKNAYSEINNMITAGATRALTTITALMARMSTMSVYRPTLGSNYTNYSGLGYNGGYKTSMFSNRPLIMAAEGGFFDKATSAIIGEGENPEMVVPLKKSGGIPTEIAQDFGRGFWQSVRKSSGDEIGFNPISNGKQGQQIIKTGDRFEFNFDNITVGGGISKSEVGKQLEKMGRVIIRTIQTSNNPGSAGR